MCMYVQDMKFLWSNLWLGGLATNNDANTNDNTNDEGHHMMDYS